MTVGSHSQSSPVFVPQPTADCRDIDPGLDATGGEQVAEIVVRDPLHAYDLGCAVHGLLALSDPHHRIRHWFARSFPLELLQKTHHVRDHRHPANGPVFGARFLIATNQDLSLREIAVGPGDVRSFALAKAAIRQETDEISTVNREPAATSLNCVDQRGELGGFREMELLCPQACSRDGLGGIVVAGTELDGDIQNVPQDLDRVVEGRWAGLLTELGSPHQALVLVDSADVRVFEAWPGPEQRRDSLVVVGFALFVGYKRLTSVKKGEPVEDELSKKVLQKTAALSYYISLYLWLAVMYVSDKRDYETHVLLAAGILGMAVVYAICWLVYNFRGVRND